MQPRSRLLTTITRMQLNLLIIDWSETVTDRNRDLAQELSKCWSSKTQAMEPSHCYGIALRIEQISAAIFRVNPGSP